MVNNQTLICDVRKCDRGDFDSICHNMARKCLDEDKAMDFILGTREEAKDQLDPKSKTNIDVLKCLTIFYGNGMKKSGAYYDFHLLSPITVQSLILLSQNENQTIVAMDNSLFPTLLYVVVNVFLLSIA